VQLSSSTISAAVFNSRVGQLLQVSATSYLGPRSDDALAWASSSHKECRAQSQLLGHGGLTFVPSPRHQAAHPLL
jgi:hypothetical protein